MTTRKTYKLGNPFDPPMPDPPRRQAPPPKPPDLTVKTEIREYVVRVDGTEEWTPIRCGPMQDAVLLFASRLSGWDGSKIRVELKTYLEAYSIYLFDVRREADGRITGHGATMEWFDDGHLPY